MAEVDFSHAKIEPMQYQAGQYYQATSPAHFSYVTLNRDEFAGTSGIVANNISKTILVNERNQLVVQYQGSFIASGTEFYLQLYTADGVSRSARWRVYNISFNSGDTFIFQIKADLICQ